MEDRNLYGRATGLQERGKYATFAKALDAAVDDLLTEKNPFFDAIVDRWSELFPTLPVRPGRSEDGIVFLYVSTAPLLFAMRSKLPAIRAKLKTLPGAPKRLVVKLEARAR